MPDHITVHLGSGYDSTKTRALLAASGYRGQIARRGLPAPVQVGARWVVERTKRREALCCIPG